MESNETTLRKVLDDGSEDSTSYMDVVTVGDTGPIIMSLKDGVYYGETAEVKATGSSFSEMMEALAEGTLRAMKRRFH